MPTGEEDVAAEENLFARGTRVEETDVRRIVPGQVQDGEGVPAQRHRIAVVEGPADLHRRDLHGRLAEVCGRIGQRFPRQGMRQQRYAGRLLECLGVEDMVPVGVGDDDLADGPAAPRRFLHDLARGLMRGVDHQRIPRRRVGDQVGVGLDRSADDGDDLERHLPSSLVRD